MACFLLSVGWALLGETRVVLRVVPIENGGNVVVGEVAELFAVKLYGDMPQNFVTVRANDGNRIAAKAQAEKVNGVFAEDVVAHAHVGEASPSEGVGCVGWCGLVVVHGASRIG